MLWNKKTSHRSLGDLITKKVGMIIKARVEIPINDAVLNVFIPWKNQSGKIAHPQSDSANTMCSLVDKVSLGIQKGAITRKIIDAIIAIASLTEEMFMAMLANAVLFPRLVDASLTPE